MASNVNPDNIFVFKFLLVVWLCEQVQGQVDSYKGANMDIGEDCKNLSELLLVRIDPKKIYEDLNFDVDQVRNMNFKFIYKSIFHLFKKNIDVGLDHHVAGNKFSLFKNLFVWILSYYILTSGKSPRNDAEEAIWNAHWLGRDNESYIRRLQEWRQWSKLWLKWEPLLLF